MNRNKELGEKYLPDLVNRLRQIANSISEGEEEHTLEEKLLTYLEGIGHLVEVFQVTMGAIDEDEAPREFSAAFEAAISLCGKPQNELALLNLLVTEKGIETLVSEVLR